MHVFERVVAAYGEGREMLLHGCVCARCFSVVAFHPVFAEVLTPAENELFDACDHGRHFVWTVSQASEAVWAAGNHCWNRTWR